MSSDLFYQAAERRIECLTLVVGLIAATVAEFVFGWRVAVGVVLGASLSWVNYRWLKQGLGPLVKLAGAQQDAPKVKVPRSVYLKFVGRYALLIGVLYAIFSYSLLPAAAVLGGLFALVAAVILEILYQLARGTALNG